MADQFIQLPTDSTGKKVDTSELTVNSQTVERQRINVADPTTAAAIAAVENAEPASTDYGLATRRVCVGASFFHLVATGTSGDANNVKASAGRVVGWCMYNNAPYPIYVKLHNTAGTPTAGSGVVYTIALIPGGPPSTFDDDDGLALSTGIGLTIVKDITDSGATSVSANDCVVNLHYK